MKGLLFLLYGTEILSAVLCGTENPTTSTAGLNSSGKTEVQSATMLVTVPTSSFTSPRSTPKISSSMTTRSPTPPAQFSSRPSTSSSPGSQPTTLIAYFYRKECLPILMVTGGLLIACTFLLLSTLLLACKVCQLSGRIKALRSNTDVMESFMESAKKDTSEPETEPKETNMQMTDFSQTQEETGNGTTVEEGGTVNENNNKEVGDADNSEATSAAPVSIAQDVSSSKLQEEATNSQPTTAVEASTSEGTEEPTDVV
uniref:mucin-5AC n=1 Tax=Scatophagus argus TaxID=75038 RepID=UPI001ED7CEA4|nr:mucin-5AC [Scatophagus argus]